MSVDVICGDDAESDEWRLGFKVGARYTPVVRAFLLRAHAPSWPADRLRGFLAGVAWAVETMPHDVAPHEAN